MDFVTNILAQAAPQGGGGTSTMIMMALMFGGMYFLVIAPQRKKQKQQKQMIDELKSGANVVTSGGIFGTITNVKDDRFILRIAEGTKIEIAKSSIGSVIPDSE